MLITSNNSIDALYLDALECLVKNGAMTMPRGYQCLELSPFCTVLTDIQNNILTNPFRKASKRFMAAELLWILLGREDVEMIGFYSKKVKAYSDDGLTFFGAYGPKIMGQLSYVENALRRDPWTRQAVLTIWRENPPQTKDVPCLGKNTLMKSPEGDLTIEALSNKFLSGEVKRYPLLSFNKKTKRVSLQWCSRAFKSGKKKVIEIIFTDGSSLTVTPDHKLYKKIKRHIHGSKAFIMEVGAKELQPGDKVWATKFIKLGKYKRQGFIHNLSQNWHYKNQISFHQTYDIFLNGPRPKGIDVHHSNGNQQDDRAENLIRLSHGKHSRLERLQTFRKKGYHIDQKNRQKHRYTNHTIKKIIEKGEEDVYDFTMEDSSNAVVGTGVIVHNCTITMQFIRRPLKRLNLNVYMRSQDAWLGFPYDLHNFTCLQLILASILGLEPGKFTLIQGSFHAYEPNFKVIEEIIKTSSKSQVTPLATCSSLKVLEQELSVISQADKLVRDHGFLLVPDIWDPLLKQKLGWLVEYWKKLEVDGILDIQKKIHETGEN